jgi:hypothetical protein
MWCPSCSADVAAEVTADERRFLCTRCQTELGLTAATTRPATTPPFATERDARELLAKWSAQSLLEEPLRPVVAAPKPIAEPPLVESETAAPPVVVAIPKPGSAKRRKIVRRETASKDRDSTFFAIPAKAPIPLPPRSSSGVWLSTMGHLAAYAGIGLITCGTVLVIWSHYGGPATYAPTGWLIAALGQMLFFLGLVNLVSGGLEQTSADLRQQLAELTARQYRQDDSHPPRELAGPHFGRRRSSRRQRHAA